MNEIDLTKEIIEQEPNPSPISDMKQDETETPIGNGEEENHSTNQEYKFDPSIHRTDSTGNPIRNKDGSFQRKRGRKAGQQYSGKTSTGEVIDDSNITQANQLGLVTAETIFTLCSGMFGPEWQPIVDEKAGINERMSMQVAWSQYYLATGKRDFPPGMIVAVAMLTYSAPRFRHENTRSKFGRLGQWVYGGVKWVGSKLFKSRKVESEVK